MINKFRQGKLNVCVLGGGSIGTMLAADLTKKNVTVSVFTSDPMRWDEKKTVKLYDSQDNILYVGKVNKVSNDPRETIVGADILLSTFPSNVFATKIKEIEKYIDDDTWLGMIPGSGGKEYYCQNLIKKGCKFFGFQRVHGIARIKEYGKSVYDLGRKESLFISSIPANDAKEVANLIETLLDIKCVALPNYLNITLTPSNPILHTARLYSLFRNQEKKWDYNPYFYRDWTNDSSKILLKCDDELQNIVKKLKKLDLSFVKSLREHYQSYSIVEMTKKISSIVPFKDLKAPMVLEKERFIPDLNSRYFLEDFPYGLAIIKGFAEVVDVETPAIDTVLKWYEEMMRVDYYNSNQFQGKDLQELPIPKNFGLKSVEDIESFYM